MPDPQEHIRPNTYLKYHAIYPFWPDLSIESNCPCHTLNLSESVHNLRYPAHKQTYRQTGVKTQPPSTFGGGGNKYEGQNTFATNNLNAHPT